MIWSVAGAGAGLRLIIGEWDGLRESGNWAAALPKKRAGWGPGPTPPCAEAATPRSAVALWNKRLVPPPRHFAEAKRGLLGRYDT
jgi:hypothetical protein